MPKTIAFVLAAALAAFAALAPASASEHGFSRAPALSDAAPVSEAVYVAPPGGAEALFQRVASKPCCYNNGEFFQSTPSTCRKYGGRTVAFEYCERQYWQYQWNNGNWANRPCCRNNGQYFNASAKTCARYGGRIVPQNRCNQFYGGQYDFRHNDNRDLNAEKPCCYNNGQYFNSTPKTCRKYGGVTVPMRFCIRQNYR